MDEADPAMLSLFPVNAALGSLVSRIVSSELVALDGASRFVSPLPTLCVGRS